MTHTARSPRTLLCSILGLVLSASALHAAPYYSAWLQEYDADQNSATWQHSQGATAIAMDKHGNVFVTGYAKDTADKDRYYTAKYDALDGHLVWQRFVTTTNAARPTAICVDSVGDVIVTGSVNTSGDNDFYTIKYGGADGGTKWGVQYDGTAGGDDVASKVCVDANDDVIVTGKSVGSGAGYDIYTTKYAKATGAVLWGAGDRYNATNRDDVPFGLIVDGSSNTIIVGESGTGSGIKSFYIRKLDSTAVVQWTKTLDTGGDGGARAVAVDGAGKVFTTGLYTDANGYHGYYTVCYSAAGVFDWQGFVPTTADDYTGAPTSIAIGPDGHAVVTGSLEDASSTPYAYTIKYHGATGGVLGQIGDGGLTGGETRARQVITDGSSNTIIVGESDTEDLDTDFYIAKYDSTLDNILYAASYGGDFGSDDVTAGIATDPSGSVAIAGAAYRNVDSTGRTKLNTIKFNRLFVATGDAVPGIADATFAAASTPALGDNGALAVKVTILADKKKLAGIFAETAAGGSSLPAVQNGTAPGTGNLGKYKSFSDPIMAPNGRYAFAAKLTGVPGATGDGVWTNLSGTLAKALQKGTPVPGLAAVNVSAVASLSMRNDRLIALLKVTGPAPSNMVLLGLDAANNGTVLLRTGNAVTVDNIASTIKKITVLSPAKLSPGDGRWQGDGSVVASATLADKRTVLFKITTAGTLTKLLASEQDASGVVNGAAWKTFSLPAIGTAGTRFAALGTLAVKKDTVTAKNDTALLYSATGAAFTAFAKEGSAPSDPNFSAFLYSAFSDPLVNANGKVAFLGKFTGDGVKAANGTALFYGDPAAAIPAKARLGDKATDSAGTPGGVDDPAWGSFVATALSSGANGGPIFVAKLTGKGATGKNNLGIWALDSTGKFRRLLRTGDDFGGKTVTKFSLLNIVPTAFGAARSFNATGSVGVFVTLSDKTQGVITIGIP